MTTTGALRALGSSDASVRLQAALAIGSRGAAEAAEVAGLRGTADAGGAADAAVAVGLGGGPESAEAVGSGGVAPGAGSAEAGGLAEVVGALVERCAVEPDFFVRDMLTWALTRCPAAVTVPRLVAELGSERVQARSQALHTLSKIGDRRAWPAITRRLLTDPHDEVARAAWRTAAALVPAGAEGELAAVLGEQLGRGGRETQLSLSRALIALGEAAEPVLRAAAADPEPRVRQHAIATERLAEDPDAGFEFAVAEATRIMAVGD